MMPSTAPTPLCESVRSLRWHHATPLTGDVAILQELAELAEIVDLAVNHLEGECGAQENLGPRPLPLLTCFCL